MDALEVYQGSDGALTKRYYSLLALSGDIGSVAMNLFRTQKASARAKVYRGGVKGRGSYKSMAYDKKGWSIEQLCKVLVMHPETGITFGWKIDPKMVALHDPSKWVLYVDLPEGQVSFHSPKRYEGPDYPGEWDGVKNASGQRIVNFCNRIVRERSAQEFKQVETEPARQIGMFR
jgi:hypothetical protein